MPRNGVAMPLEEYPFQESSIGHGFTRIHTDNKDK